MKVIFENTKISSSNEISKEFLEKCFEHDVISNPTLVESRDSRDEDKDNNLGQNQIRSIILLILRKKKRDEHTESICQRFNEYKNEAVR